MNTINSDIIITSGYNIEGYRIKRYINYISAVTVLGTGFSNSLEATVAEFTGSRSSGYEEKLSEAASSSIRELKRRASAMGANAIIGLDVDYCSRGISGVSAGGTAVLCEADESHYRYLPVHNYNISVPFNISGLSYRPAAHGRTDIFLNGCVYGGQTLSAISATIDMTTIFNEPIPQFSVTFPKISRKQYGVFETAEILVNLNTSVFDEVKKVCVHADKYIIGDEILYADINEERHISLSDVQLTELRRTSNIDAVRPNLKGAERWECCCGQDNPPHEEYCLRCHRNSSGEMKINGVYMSSPPIVAENGMWECPCCGKLHQPREKCWSCGNTFYTGKPPATV